VFDDDGLRLPPRGVGTEPRGVPGDAERLRDTALEARVASKVCPMALTMYKKGQGYYVRLCSAVALGVISLMGGKWVWDLLQNKQTLGLEAVYVQASGALILVAALSLIGWWLIGTRRRSVDFMIAVEGEMKKVNWSTRREVMGSTWVVILLTIFVAAFCFAWDFVFQWFFRFVGVLQTTRDAAGI
jgi:preprotein translocase SecE subunit